MLGLKIKKNVEKICLTDDEKRIIIEEFLQSGRTKQAIWDQYVGYGYEKGNLLRWMRRLGYIADSKRKDDIFVLQTGPMSNNQKANESYSSFEYVKLQKHVEKLEKQLHESELQVLTYQTMIDIAERELNISIKKKFNTKPSKQ
jgi:hypothetical protein